jgi:hypothetical protein
LLVILMVKSLRYAMALMRMERINLILSESVQSRSGRRVIVNRRRWSGWQRRWSWQRW